MTFLGHRPAAAAAVLLFTAAVLRAQTPVPSDILPDAWLQGWTRIPIPAAGGLHPKIQWHVDTTEKALVCTGDGGHEWLRYDRELGEIGYQEQTGLAGGYIVGANIVDGALKSFNRSKAMKENRVKPAGEWNHYEIRGEGERITLSVNGAVVSEVENACLRRGYIGL